jgi:hypothetical protein
MLRLSANQLKTPLNPKSYDVALEVYQPHYSCSLGSLDNYVLKSILQFCDGKTLTVLATTSHGLRIRARDLDLWRNIFEKELKRNRFVRPEEDSNHSLISAPFGPEVEYRKERETFFKEKRNQRIREELEIHVNSHQNLRLFVRIFEGNMSVFFLGLPLLAFSVLLPVKLDYPSSFSWFVAFSPLFIFAVILLCSVISIWIDDSYFGRFALAYPFAVRRNVEFNFIFLSHYSCFGSLRWRSFASASYLSFLLLIITTPIALEISSKFWAAVSLIFAFEVFIFTSILLPAAFIHVGDCSTFLIPFSAISLASGIIGTWILLLWNNFFFKFSTFAFVLIPIFLWNLVHCCPSLFYFSLNVCFLDCCTFILIGSYFPLFGLVIASEIILIQVVDNHKYSFIWISISFWILCFIIATMCCCLQDQNMLPAKYSLSSAAQSASSSWRCMRTTLHLLPDILFQRLSPL